MNPRAGLLILALVPGCEAGPLPPPNWLIIAPDSFCADRIGARPDGSVAAPHMTDLAAEGVTFTHAFSQSGWTSPALASLLTGHYPTIMDSAPPGAAGGIAWMPGTRTLAEILRYYGYHTAAFWGDSLPSRVPAFSVGFDDVDTHPPTMWSDHGAPFARWMAAGDHEPFFAVLHDTDFSGPVQPGAAFSGPEEAHQVYDAGVRRYDDEVVTTAIKALIKAGVYDRTIIVITSNHGMDFYEHDSYVSHGMLYDSTIRVPFVYHDAAAPQRSVRIPVTIQGIDLAPTVLERSGIPRDQTMNGQSILPLLGMSDGTYTPRDVYTGTSEFDMAIRTDRYKLISCRADCCGGTGPQIGKQPGQCAGPVVHKLYDHVADPGETHDIAADQVEVVAELSARLHAWQMERATEARGATRWQVDEAQKELLQKRGYWDLVFPAVDGGKEAEPGNR